MSDESQELDSLFHRWNAEGDADALDRLIEAEVHRLATFLRQKAANMLSPDASADDAAQQAFLNWYRLEDRPLFRNRRDMRAYLRKAALRICVSRWRRARPLPIHLDECPSTLGTLLEFRDERFGEVEDRDELDVVEGCLESVPPEDRAMIEWYFFQGKSFRAIARESGCSRQTVCGRLNAAVRRLRGAVDA